LASEAQLQTSKEMGKATIYQSSNRMAYHQNFILTITDPNNLLIIKSKEKSPNWLYY